ncbi:MAG TPA: hypothetical protein VLE48_11285 [Terriglobales bacterium]|nr:hypothetical protein [Terriglobales bacterium]
MQDDLAFLLAEHESPCLSLYQPTHRHHPENLQDPIRYRNLLKALEASLRQHSAREVDQLLAPFQELAHDTQFWNHTADGLAVLGSPGVFRVFTLQRPVGELAVVANSFHVKPLLRILQSAGRYQVLCLNRQEIKLFEGDFSVLGEVALAAGVPRTITDALGEELTELHQTVASYGGTALGSNMRHAHGSKKDALEIDDERFFRAVDRAILEHHSTPSGLPLILASLRQYQTPFRQVSHNPFLLPKGIEIDPASLGIEQLRERTWEIIEPQLRTRLRDLAAQFEEAKAKGLGSDDLGTIAEAAVHGRVGSLLVEAERQVPGRVDPETGRVTLNDLKDPQVDDLLDDLAELALKNGGEVVVAPAASMPAATGAAATFRF